MRSALFAMIFALLSGCATPKQAASLAQAKAQIPLFGAPGREVDDAWEPVK